MKKPKHKEDMRKSITGMPQLFLLHFAGGNRYSYDFMRPYLSEFEFIPIELPGRGKRTREKLLYDFNLAAQDLFRQVSARRTTCDFILYGHSLGAIMALKLAGMFEQIRMPPLYIVVTGNAGPGIGDDDGHQPLDKVRFKEELKSLGGVSELFLQTEDAYDFYYPILKADFELAKGPAFSSVPPVNAPVYALAGREEAAAHHIDNWKNFTLSYSYTEVLPGNHFFIYEHTSRIASIIKKAV